MERYPNRDLSVIDINPLPDWSNVYKPELFYTPPGKTWPGFIISTSTGSANKYFFYLTET
jgi:hypothetical protein